tara:strand:- start:3635 stop:4363 length:729 start_codon:yes stop_codon:yes gene_type:complete
MKNSMTKQKSYDYNTIPIGFYDQIFSRKSGIRSAWHYIKFSFLKSKISKNNYHLDIGCGPGTFIGFLQTKKSVGVDISKKQIDYANKLYKKKNKKFIKMKKNNIPFKKNSFDSISMIELIEHLPKGEILKLINESHTKMKPGGKLYITTPNYRSIWPLLELIVNLSSEVSYEDQHITKLNKKKLLDLIDLKKFKVTNISTYIFLSPFLAFFSFRLAISFLKIDNFLTYFFPGHSIYLELEKI